APERVDADRRPDLARRLAPGGVPALAILAPDGTPLVATGYAPPSVLREILRSAAFQWSTRSSMILAEARRSREAVLELTSLRPSRGLPDEGFVRAAVGELVESADPSGGWGESPAQLRAASLRLLALRPDVEGAAETLARALAALKRGPLAGAEAGTYFSDAEDGDPPDTLERPAELADLLVAFRCVGDREAASRLEARLRSLRGPGGAVPVALAGPIRHLETAESTFLVAEALGDLPEGFPAFFDPATGLVRHRAGVDDPVFHLADQAAALAALLPHDRPAAGRLADAVTAHFFSPGAPAWRDRLGPPVEFEPLDTPAFPVDDNARLAGAVLHLGTPHADRAESVLSGFVDAYRGLGHPAARLALAITRGRGGGNGPAPV
ncbi:MAG: hypothetical protein HUU15_18315, partial [Candidatus Brocadiae bacterium]|nr:hypothetical protein [Candidatus Brocadiia bacterium]